MIWTRTSPAEYARELGISTDAVHLCRDHDFIDLHLDGFIPTRLFGYDLCAKHEQSSFGGFFFGHLDFPRSVDAGLTGAMWSITTNPFRSKEGRHRTLLRNIRHIQKIEEQSTGAIQCVRNLAEYETAKQKDAHALFMVIQGGNALCARHGYAHAIPDNLITAVTLLHLTHSQFGASSVPIWSRKGTRLTQAGHELVRSLNEKQIFVDLAHIHPDGFWDVVRTHDSSQPLINTHTGVCGVKPHWRNLDDAQIKAIADTGGVVGVIFQKSFLKSPGRASDIQMIIDHIDHIVEVAGDDVPALGSDYDGAIIPPKELRDGRAYPRLIQAMLDRGYTDERIIKILGTNFLRAFGRLRPG